VREQIEVIKGQMKYYEESARLSSITVELIANQAVQPITAGGWEPVGVIKDAIQALINGMQVIFNIGTYLILTVLPILLVIFLPIYLIVRGVIRWRRQRKNKRGGDKAEYPPEINLALSKKHATCTRPNCRGGGFDLLAEQGVPEAKKVCLIRERICTTSPNHVGFAVDPLSWQPGAV
jgi:hypothetical protein